MNKKQTTNNKKPSIHGLVAVYVTVAAARVRFGVGAQQHVADERLDDFQAHFFREIVIRRGFVGSNQEKVEKALQAPYFNAGG
jgi:hypothetical protein